MKTIEFLGEENFLRVCKEFSLTEEEIELLRKVIDKWDEILKIPDQGRRLDEKTKIGIEAFQKISPARRDKFLGALLKVNLFFAEFYLNRE